MPERKKTTFVDVSKLRISDDPLPISRLAGRAKYAEIFGKLKPGQCVVCEPHEVMRISKGLREWLKDTGSDCLTRATKNYTDGKGRVWMLPPAGGEVGPPETSSPAKRRGKAG